MNHRSKHDASKDDEHEAGKEGITTSEPFACRRVEAVDGTHTPSNIAAFKNESAQGNRSTQW